MTTFLQVLAALPGLIQAILELMKLAEQAIPDKGTGADKKAYVLSAIESIVNNAELWRSVQGLFSKLINALALFNFGSSGKEPSPK